MCATRARCAASAFAPATVDELVARLARGPARPTVAVRADVDPALAAAEPARAAARGRQALRGVLKNAQDASPAERRRRLTVGAVRTARVDFAVADRGAGMPPEVLARIGEPFFTTKPPGRGMGLGLFLARAVVERLGGTLQLDSERGRAAPTAIACACRCRSRRASDRGARAPVLLVDDDEIFRERLGARVRDRGYDVVTAASYDDRDGGGARARRRSSRSSISRCRAVGARAGQALHELDPQTRIVVLTGYGSIATAIDAVRLGAHDYLCKPADADDIVAALRGRRRPAPRRARARASPSRRQLARAEWEHINRMLADAGGNISEAARRLGITAAPCSSS